MGNIFYFEWEKIYLVWLQHLGEGTVLQSVLLFFNQIFSAFGEDYICVAVIGIIYWGISKEKGKRIGFAIVGALLSCGAIKSGVKRIRPYLCLDEIELLREVDGFSFPSGHSSNTAAYCSAIAYEFRDKKRFRYLAVILPILVAFSRNYLGAHWPTDVLAGLLHGVLLCGIIEYLFRKIQNPHVLYAALLVLGGIGLFFFREKDYYLAYGMLTGLVGGILLEEKAVHFENTDKWYLILLRTMGGGILYLLFDSFFDFLVESVTTSGTLYEIAGKALSLAVITFVLVGIYPLAFQLEHKMPDVCRFKRKK